MTGDDADRRDDDAPEPDRDDHSSDEGGKRVDPLDGVADDEATDPFERLDAPDRPDDSDRDPFAEIDETVADSEDATADPPSFDDLGFERIDEGEVDHTPSSSDPESRTDASAGERPDEPAGDDPFDRLGGGPRDGDPFDGLGEVDGSRAGEAFDDELWEDLSRSVAEPETEERGARRFAEVDKHSYCENCEHLSEPPDVECAHEGTDIVEFVDFETVRVADCPVVAEREELADIDAE